MNNDQRVRHDVMKDGYDDDVMKDEFQNDANGIRNTSPISRTDHRFASHPQRETTGYRSGTTSPAQNSEQENKTQLPGSTIDDFDW